MEQKISGNSKFPEKGQPREVDRNFRNEFPEISLPFDFEPEFSEILVDGTRSNDQLEVKLF